VPQAGSSASLVAGVEVREANPGSLRLMLEDRTPHRSIGFGKSAILAAARMIGAFQPIRKVQEN
jgi:hypothetical protein